MEGIMLNTEYDAIKITEEPGIHISSYKTTSIFNPEALPTDIPFLFYENGYKDGVKAASEILIRKSRACARMLKIEVFGKEERETYSRMACAYAKVGTEVCKLLKGNYGNSK